MLSWFKSSLCWTAHSDPGDLRLENEDSLFVRLATFGHRRVGLFAVADGCGGLQYGADASRLAIQAVSAFWTLDLPRLMGRLRLPVSVVFQEMERMMQRGHAQVCALGADRRSRVGSTLTVFLVINRRYWIKHVGDSRMYRLRGMRLEQLTEDQSLVAELLRSRQFGRAEDCQQNILTMSLGYGRQLYTYQRTGKLQRGDVYCLCSDGLYGYAGERLQVQLAQDPKDIQKMRGLIGPGAARDNVSFITIWEE